MFIPVITNLYRHSYEYIHSGATEIARHPRNIESLVRRQDSSRKEERERRKARKEEELWKKKEEVKKKFLKRAFKKRVDKRIFWDVTSMSSYRQVFTRWIF